MNCSPYPEATAIDDGVTAIEDKVACPIISKVELEMELDVAVIVAAPWPELVASPLLPTALLMMATLASEELQVTTEVRSCVLPSV